MWIVNVLDRVEGLQGRIAMYDHRTQLRNTAEVERFWWRTKTGRPGETPIITGYLRSLLHIMGCSLRLVFAQEEGETPLHTEENKYVFKHITSAQGSHRPCLFLLTGEFVRAKRLFPLSGSLITMKWCDKGKSRFVQKVRLVENRIDSGARHRPLTVSLPTSSVITNVRRDYWPSSGEWGRR
jgi:hypothetical protein